MMTMTTKIIKIMLIMGTDMVVVTPPSDDCFELYFDERAFLIWPFKLK